MVVAGGCELCACCFSGRELVGELGLFLFGDVVGDGSAHCLVGPFATFSLERIDPTVEAKFLVAGGGDVVLQVEQQVVPDQVGLVIFDAFSSPLREHLVFNGFGWQVRQLAAVVVAVAADAEPVGVAIAAAAGGDAVDELGAALIAVERSGKVVLATVGPFAGGAMRVEYALDGSERFGADQWLVFAGELQASPADDSDVVVVAQDLAELLGAEGSHETSGCRALGKPLDLEFVGELTQAPLPGGVRSEGPADETGPVWVGLDGSGFPALDQDPHVLVPNGCEARGAPGLHLLTHALNDFCGQVLAVELGEGAHDAVHQHPGGCLIDVLGAGDEGGAGFPDSQVDRDVVGPVAG